MTGSQSPTLAQRLDHLGVPRNYLLIDETPATVTDAAIVAALRPSFATPAVSGPSTLAPAPFDGDGMRSFVTTGPFLDVDVELDAVPQVDPVGRFLAAGGPGNAEIAVTVSGPSFVMLEVTEARLVVNGLQQTLTLAGGPGVKVATFFLTLPPGEDTWVVVEAGAELISGTTMALPPPGSTYAALYPGVPVLAWTNPIFFDRVPPVSTFDPVGN
jgi:hypothetical protein